MSIDGIKFSDIGNEKWKVGEQLTNPYSYYKEKGVGSVKERALNMELADDEAKQKEAEFKREKKEKENTWFGKFMSRIRPHHDAADVKTTRQKLDETIVQRVVGSEILSDIAELKDIFYHPEKLVDKSMKTSKTKLSQEQIELAKKYTIAEVNKSIAHLLDQLPDPVVGDLPNAKNLDQLFSIINRHEQDFFEEDEIRTAIRYVIQEKAPKGVDVSSMNNAIDITFDAFKQKAQELDPTFIKKTRQSF